MSNTLKPIILGKRELLSGGRFSEALGRRQYGPLVTKLGATSGGGISIVSGAFTATDSANGGPTTPAEYNTSTIPVTTIAGDIIVSFHHSEFPTPSPGGPTSFGEFYWLAQHAGNTGRLMVTTDGYAGGANNRQFRCWVWTNPTPGTNNVVTICGVRTTPSTSDQELAVAVFVLRGAATRTNPFGGVTLDISASNRSGESETVTSAVNDLILHAIGNSLFTKGTLGSGETSRIVANDRPPDAIGDDAGIWVSTKAGAAGTTTVSSSGWATTFPLQGMGLAVKPAGTAENLNPFFDTFTRANENPLSPSTWATVSNTAVTAMKIVSNQCVGTTAGENMVRIGAAHTPAGTLRRVRFRYAGANFSGCCLLFQGSGASCYTASTNGNDIQIIKLSDISGTAINYANVLTTWTCALGLAAGDYIELEADISVPSAVVLRLYWNQVLATSITDSTSPYATGPGGLRIFGANAVATHFEYTEGVIRY